jgi:NitT/TauT family transport system permease protein
MNMTFRRLKEKLIFLVLLILIWELIYVLGVHVFAIWKSYTMPSPVGAFHSLINLFHKNSIFVAIIISFKRIFIGFFISIIIGGILGLLITNFQYLNRNLKPLILGLQTLPSICWVPFAILWYGINDAAIIFVIVIGSAFSIATSVESSINNINPIYIKAAKTMGTEGKDLYLKVILPASIPELLSGLKQAWSFAWRALMSGEMMSSTIGLGQVLLMGRELADINQVMVVMILIISIGSLVERLFFGRIEVSVRNKMGLNKQ